MATSHYQIQKQAMKAKAQKHDERLTKACFGQAPMHMADGGFVAQDDQRPVTAMGQVLGGSLASRPESQLQHVDPTALTGLATSGVSGQPQAPSTLGASVGTPFSAGVNFGLPAKSVAGPSVAAQPAQVATTSPLAAPAPILGTPIPSQGALPMTQLPRRQLQQDPVIQAKSVYSFGMAEGGMVGDAKAALDRRKQQIDEAEMAAVNGKPAAPRPEVKPVVAPAPQPEPRGFIKTMKTALGFGFAHGGLVCPHGMAASKCAACGYAHGGVVQGPGTPTSDSIPARLSKDEFVMPADSVRAIGAHNLEAMRQATHTPVGAKFGSGYRDGGDVRFDTDANGRAIPRAPYPPIEGEVLPNAAEPVAPRPALGYTATPQAPAPAANAPAVYDPVQGQRFGPPRQPLPNAEPRMRFGVSPEAKAYSEGLGKFPGGQTIGEPAPAPAPAPAAQPAAPAAKPGLFGRAFRALSNPYVVGAQLALHSGEAGAGSDVIRDATTGEVLNKIAATNVKTGEPMTVDPSTKYAAPSTQDSAPSTQTPSAPTAPTQSPLQAWQNEQLTRMGAGPGSGYQARSDLGAPGEQILQKSNSYVGVGGPSSRSSSGNITFGMSSGAYGGGQDKLPEPPQFQDSPDAQRIDSRMAELAEQLKNTPPGTLGRRPIMRELAALGPAAAALRAQSTAANAHAQTSYSNQATQFGHLLNYRAQNATNQLAREQANYGFLKDVAERVDKRHIQEVAEQQQRHENIKNDITSYAQGDKELENNMHTLAATEQYPDGKGGSTTIDGLSGPARRAAFGQLRDAALAYKTSVDAGKIGSLGGLSTNEPAGFFGTGRHILNHPTEAWQALKGGVNMENGETSATRLNNADQNDDATRARLARAPKFGQTR